MRSVPEIINIMSQRVWYVTSMHPWPNNKIGGAKKSKLFNPRNHLDPRCLSYLRPKNCLWLSLNNNIITLYKHWDVHFVERFYMLRAIIFLSRYLWFFTLHKTQNCMQKCEKGSFDSQRGFLHKSINTSWHSCCCNKIHFGLFRSSICWSVQILKRACGISQTLLELLVNCPLCNYS